MKNRHAMLYRFDAEGYEHEVIHLYEHMVLNCVTALLQASGYGKTFFGWTEGTAYLKRIYIHAGFYSKEVADIFDNFMLRSESHISLDDIEHEIRLLEAEKRIVFDIPDATALRDALVRLDTLPWHNAEDITSPFVLEPFLKNTDHTLLPFHKSAKSFRDIAAGIYIDSITAEEIALLTRVSIPVLSMFNAVMSDLHGYEKEYFNVRIRDDFRVATGARYTVRRGTVTAAQIKARLQQVLSEFDVSAWQDKDAFFDAFVHSPYYTESVLDHYDDVGLVATRQQISALATNDNLAKLFKRMNVQVTPID